MTPDTLNFDPLMAPIPGENAAGADLRLDRGPGSAYAKIRDARNLARQAERRLDQGFGDENGQAGQAWRSIAETAPEILAGQSKDLEIAAILCEALLRLHGFAGLRDGFRLVRGLVEGFWDQLYPLPDEDGVATRVAPLSGLNGVNSDGTLIQPIRQVFLTMGSPGPFNYAHYQQAGDLNRVSNAQILQQRIAAGAVTMDAFIAAAQQTPHEFYVTLLGDLDGCGAELNQLSEVLDERCGDDAPAVGRIKELLGEVRDAVLAMAPSLAVATPAAPVAGEVGTEGVGTVKGGLINGPTSISSREDAFNLLLSVARYFRQTEPQSTLPLVLEEAVRRARLSLPELLLELIEDQNARRQFFLAAGLKPPQS